MVPVEADQPCAGVSEFETVAATTAELLNPRAIGLVEVQTSDFGKFEMALLYEEGVEELQADKEFYAREQQEYGDQIELLLHERENLAEARRFKSHRRPQSK